MALDAFGQMIWLDTERGVSIAQRPGRRRSHGCPRGRRGHTRRDASDRRCRHRM